MKKSFLGRSCTHCYPPTNYKDGLCIVSDQDCVSKDGWHCSNNPDKLSTIRHQNCYPRGMHIFKIEFVNRCHILKTMYKGFKIFDYVYISFFSRAEVEVRVV